MNRELSVLINFYIEILYPVCNTRIIIADSGMANGGRILYHFKRLLRDHRTTVLFTSYQTANTCREKMIDGAGYRGILKL
ncbi:MAG: hypothetical protein GXP11_06660 [Gammaproteobacteria bacterium]|nr:hypothetical protein [Gammaproteobacteria bacterium]